MTSSIRDKYMELWKEQDELICNTNIPLHIAKERVRDISVEQTKIRRSAEEQGLDIDFNELDADAQLTRPIPETSIYA